MTQRFASSCLSVLLSLAVPSAQAGTTTYFYRHIDGSTAVGTPSTGVSTGGGDAGTTPPSPGTNNGGTADGGAPAPSPTPSPGTNQAAFQIATPASQRGRVTKAFRLAIQQAGGQGAIRWANIGDPLPAGLSLGQDGVISGVPSAATRSESVQIQATDSTGASAQTYAFAIDILPLPTIAVPTPVAGTVGESLSIAPSVTDAYGSRSWRVAFGALPAGLTLDAATGAIPGTPTAAGSSAGIGLSVTDGDGATGNSNAFTVNVAPAGTLSYPSATLDVGTDYSFAPQVGGLTQPLTYTLKSRDGAANCSGPDAQGTLTCRQDAGDGAVGTYVVTATDSAGRVATSAPASFTNGASQGLTVAGGTFRARAGAPFSGSAAASNARGSVAYSALDALPPGFTLDGSSGSVTSASVPASAVGTAHARISATTSSGGATQSSSGSYAFIVAQPLSVSAPAIPGQAVQGNPLSIQGTVSNLFGGSSSVPGIAASGLPDGLSATGTANGYSITGTPSKAGTFAFKVTATDPADGSSASATSSVTVAPADATATPPALSLVEGDAASFKATSDLQSPTWTWTGAPSWLSLTQSGGTLSASGTSPDVAQATSYTVTATATSGSASASASVKVDVAAAAATATDPGPVRSGGAVSIPVSTTMAAPGSWSLASGPSGLAVASPASKSTSVTGTAPANATSAPATQTLTATFTASAAPSSGQPASASASPSLTVYPALSVGQAANASFTAGSAFTAQAPSTVGAYGTVSWQVRSGGQDVSDTLSSILPGLSFDRSTGMISGTPARGGSATLSYRAHDDGRGLTAMAADADSNAFSVTGAEASASVTDAHPSLAPGGSLDVTVTTSIDTPNWTLAGAPSWIVQSPNGKSLRLTGTAPALAQATDLGLTAKASNAAGSTSTAIAIHVDAVTASLAGATTRGGRAFSTALTTNYPGGAWSMQPTNPADVTFSGYASGSFAGTAPAVAGTSPVTRTMVSALTGGVTSSPATLTVYPDLGVGNQASQSGVTGGGVSFAAPAVTGAIGAVTWKLSVDGGGDVTSSLGSVCPGLSFDPASGAVTGTAQGACATSLRYAATDDAGGATDLRETASSPPFTLRIVDGRVSLSVTPGTTVTEGDAIAISASSNVGHPTYSVTGAPAWMRFQSNADGTYSASGPTADVAADTSYPLTVSVAGDGSSASGTVTVTVKAATATLASVSARSGAAFSMALSDTMAAQATWNAASPQGDVTGLAVSANAVTGTAPANNGPSAVTRTVTATHTANAAPSSGTPASTSATATLTVQPALSVASLGAQAGNVGSPMSVAAPAVSGKVGGLSYALLQGSADVSSSLGSTCPGLSFSTATGAISGTPSAACSANLTHRVSDDGAGDFNLAASATSQAPFALSVGTASVTASASSLTVTEGDTVSLSATTSLPSPTWTVSGNPSWMAFTSNGGSYATNGASGDVSSATTYTVTLTATSGSYSAQRTVNVTVNPATATLATPAPVRSGGTFSAAASTSMAAPGSWSATSAPADVTLLAVSGGSLTGKAPSNAGTTAITRALTVTFTGPAVSAGARAMASATATLTVQPSLAIAAPANQAGQAGAAVSFAAPAVTGGTGALTYALLQGSTDVSSTLGTACPGLSFSASTGAVTGTPSGACSATLAYRVSDDGQPSPSTLAATATSTTFTLAVTGATGSASASTVSVTEGSPAPFSATTTLPNPTWSATGNPAWMTFAASNGTYATSSVSPDVSTAQTYSVTLTATNGSGASTTSAVTVNVAPATAAVGSVSARSGAGFSMPLSTTMAAAGGWTAPATQGDVAGISVSGQSLAAVAPANAGASAVTRTLSATYTAATAPSSGAAATATGSGTLTVQPALTLASLSARSGTVGSPLSVSPPAVGGAVGNLSYSLFQGSTDVSSTLSSACPGLSFSKTDGSITGTPGGACSVTLKHQVTDNGGGDPNLVATASSASAFTLSVGSATVTATASTLTGIEGDAYAVSATTTLPNPTWTVSGNPSWMAFTSSGGTYATNSVSADVASATTSSVVLTATSGSYSASTTVSVTVNPATASMTTPATVRSGGAFTSTVSTSMAASGTWTASAAPADVTGLSVSGSTLSGTAPANAGTASITRTLTATRTGPSPTAGTAASASGSATLTVMPSLAVASPANQTGQAGAPVSFAAPSVTGRSGTLTYALMQGSTDITSTFGTTGGTCPGLAFSSSTGAVSGTPKGSCTASLAYRVSDDGQPSPSTLAATATSTAFTLTVTGATSTASTSTLPIVEGSTATFSVTTSLPNPTWSVTGNPAWMTFTANGSTYSTSSVSADVTSTQTYTVAVTASNASGASAPAATVTVTVSPASPSVGSASVRSGGTFSVGLTSGMAVASTWTASANPADVTGLSVSGSTLSGTAPANNGAAPITRSLNGVVTASTGPSTGAAATASAAGTLTVQPALSIATQSARTASVGTPTAFNPPSVTGAVGNLSYKLMSGSTDVSDTLASYCGGLAFRRSDGTVSGTPSATCTQTLTYQVADDGGATPALAATATSPATFTLTVGAATVTPSTTSLTPAEGDTVSFSATTSLANPTWSVSGNPAWMTFTSSGGTYSTSSVSADVTADTTYPVVLTATSGSYSAQATVNVTVYAASTATGYSTPFGLRVNTAFSTQVATNMPAPGKFTASPDVNDLQNLAISNGYLTGTSPATVTLAQGQNYSPRTVTVTYTANAVPSSGAAAKASGPARLFVYPNLAFASAPANQAGARGTALTAVNPPALNGQAGTIVYSLFSGGTDITTSLNSASYCPGLSFSTSTGQITGTPTAGCNLNLTYQAFDKVNAAPSLQQTVQSAQFNLNVTNSVPNQFSFSPVSNATGNTAYNAVTNLTGMTAAGSFSVSSATGATVAVSINGAAYTTTIPGSVPANASVGVQVTSAAGTNGGTQSATVNVSGVTATFTVTTIDTTPDAFSWPAQTGLFYGTTATSSTVTITGLTAPATLTVAGSNGPASVSVSGGAYSSGTQTVSNGQTVTVSMTMGRGNNQTSQATVTIGGVSGTFTATTGSNTPTSFNCSSGINSVFPANGGQEYYCDIYPSGMSLSAGWTASGSFNRVYTDATGWTTASSGTLSPNARIILAVLAPAGTAGGTNVGYIQVGGAQQSLTVRTGDSTPNAFSFNNIGGQPINQFVGSNAITVSGIDIGAPVSVSGGYVSINGANWAQSGTIYNGQSLSLAQTTSGAYNATVGMSVYVGNYGTSWYASTGDYPCDGQGNSATNQNEYYYYNADVQQAGWTAIRHFIIYGYYEGRKSCYANISVCPVKGDATNTPGNANTYYWWNPDVKNAGLDAYQHWLNYGINEGRVGCYARPNGT